MSYLFGLSSDQRELQHALRRMLDHEYGSEAMRVAVASPLRFAEPAWKQLADLGTLGIACTEAHGGSGLGMTDLVAVMETLGRMPLAAPLAESFVATHLLNRFGTDAQKANWLPRIAGGSCIATIAVDEPDSYWSAQGVCAKALSGPEGLELFGRKVRVPYAHIADLVVCSVRSGIYDAPQWVLLERADLEGRVEVHDALDDTYALCEVKLDGHTVPRSHELTSGAEEASWSEAQDVLNLLCSAELVGSMERALELLLGYAKERVQFGKPIGSYQAMKHRCADMLIDLEAVRGATYYAGWAVQERQSDRAMAVSSAKAYAADAAVRCAEKALQSFGAIGFTWEHDIHFHLKRSRRLEMQAGDARFHRERIARSLIEAVPSSELS